MPIPGIATREFSVEVNATSNQELWRYLANQYLYGSKSGTLSDQWEPQEGEELYVFAGEPNAKKLQKIVPTETITLDQLQAITGVEMGLIGFVCTEPSPSAGNQTLYKITRLIFLPSTR